MRFQLTIFLAIAAFVSTVWVASPRRPLILATSSVPLLRTTPRAYSSGPLLPATTPATPPGHSAGH
ncbi:GM25254 [Drosophila sechellia]|uniref:GM25254 n=1 Tax=Drosophila sechellia TaxID=7238 RepID=B4HDX0_DROSE|nr:GM25254 [Drosophila sechellia]